MSDIRLLVGQDIGLQFLIPIAVPIALKLLETDPPVECEHYKGDLLAVVLRANPGYFAENARERIALIEVIDLAKSRINLLDHIDFDTTNEALEEALQVFELGQKAYSRTGGVRYCCSRHMLSIAGLMPTSALNARLVTVPKYETTTLTWWIVARRHTGD